MSDDLDLNALGDDDLVQQMHDDLYDGLKGEIEDGVRILLGRGWTPYDVLTKALVEANRARFQIRTGGRTGTLIEIVFPHAVARAGSGCRPRPSRSAAVSGRCISSRCWRSACPAWR